MTAITCDVCGLPDPYNGGGDGIGSCECPRCDGGEAAASSVLCTCPPDDEYDDVLIAEVRDQLRDQGLDDDSASESIAAMRDAGMFTIPREALP